MLLRYLKSLIYNSVAELRLNKTNMEIKIENLKKIYGDKTVVDIPQLTLGSGELIGLVGNNGAGRTTLTPLS